MVNQHRRVFSTFYVLFLLIINYREINPKTYKLGKYSDFSREGGVGEFCFHFKLYVDSAFNHSKQKKS